MRIESIVETLNGYSSHRPDRRMESSHIEWEDFGIGKTFSIQDGCERAVDILKDTRDKLKCIDHDFVMAMMDISLETFHPGLMFWNNSILKHEIDLDYKNGIGMDTPPELFLSKDKTVFSNRIEVYSRPISQLIKRYDGFMFLYRC